MSSNLNQLYSSVSSNVNRVVNTFKDSGDLALVKAGMVFATQPLQVILRDQQKAVKNNESPKGMMGTSNKLFSQGGVGSFFRGSLPAATKEFIKYQTYKTPLLKGAPAIIDNALPTSFYHFPYYSWQPIKVIMAGAFAGISDTVLGGGLEAYATYRATSQGELSKASFKQELVSIPTTLGKLQRIYKGAVPATVKSTVAFSLFFGVSAPLNQQVNNYFPVEEGHSPVFVQALAAIGTGVIVAAASSPFDIAKTLAQMPAAKTEGLPKVMFDIYQHKGIRGFGAGLGTKAFMVGLGWSANSFFVQDLSKQQKPISDEPSIAAFRPSSRNPE